MFGIVSIVTAASVAVLGWYKVIVPLGRVLQLSEDLEE